MAENIQTHLPPPLPPVHAVSITTIPISSLLHLIFEKLNDKNFLLWKQQIESVIIGHRLHSNLVNHKIPLRYLFEADHDEEIENFEYLMWEQQDALLLSWLQSSLSSSILVKVIGCKHVYQLWDKLHAHFHSLITTKSQQLCTELRNKTLGGKSITEYFSSIKSVSDSLPTIGDPFPEKE